MAGKKKNRKRCKGRIGYIRGVPIEGGALHTMIRFSKGNFLTLNVFEFGYSNPSIIFKYLS